MNDTASTANASPPWKAVALRLFILSAVSLFAELLIIRWMSAEVRAFSIFKTFPLVTFYVGLGLGFATDSNKHGRWFSFGLLLFAVIIRLAGIMHFDTLVFPSLSAYNWQDVAPDKVVNQLLVFMPALVIMLSGPMLIALSLGSEMSEVFSKMRPLSAYSINLAGALVGSIAFGMLSFAELPPWQLLIIPAVLFLLCQQISLRWRLIGVLVSAAAVLLSYSPAISAQSVVLWSPYQRLDLKPVTQKVDKGTLNGLDLLSNHVPYQSAWDLTEEKARQWKIPLSIQWLQTRWTLPFQIRQPKTVLIVASGIGSDVAQGLAHNATSITAVDIDPVIIRIGRKANPLKPYSDPRVNVVCDDARHFFSQCQQKYDLIVFSHLDSHTVIGMSSAVRLDNYIYTEQSIKKALSLLKPDGIITLSFFATKSWFAERLYNTIEAAAGYPPIMLKQLPHDGASGYLPNTTFIIGNPVKDGSLVLPKIVLDEFVPLRVTSNERTLTDDWPYLYLSTNLFDPTYLAVLAEVVLIALVFSRNLLLKPAPAVNWQLFFMGAAFMLMELQFISRLALLFGSTWVTTSVVINGVLILILVANGAVSKFTSFFANKMPLLYGLLLGSLAISYMLPVSQIVAETGNNEIVAYFTICTITFLPVFMAATIFATAFASTANSTRALAFNMLGAVLGSLFEYLSNFTGINRLLLVVMLFYVISFLFANRSAKSAGPVAPEAVQLSPPADQLSIPEAPPGVD
jgi:SAM-dependent methyltransferase